MSEPTYTLAEARKEIARRECASWGHDWSVVEREGCGPVGVLCERCGESRSVEVKNRDSTLAAHRQAS